MIEKTQKETEVAFVEMKKEVQKQLILGEFTDSAALKIQRSVKLFLWRRKIKRIRFVFENYYLKSTEEFLKLFTGALNCFSAWQKVLRSRFLQYREGRLRKIRENLAIFTIKQAVQSKKINFSECIILCRRLQRRLKVLKTFQSLNQSENTDFSLSFLLQNLQNEPSEVSSEKPAPHPLPLAQLLYNIRNTPNQTFTPMLPTRPTRKSLSLSLQKPEKTIQKFRRLIIATPPVASQKKQFGNMENQSRLVSYPIKEQEYYRKRPLSSTVKVPEDKNFLRPTLFYIRKFSDEGVQWKAKKKIRKARPPSLNLTRNTVSSMAKSNRNEWKFGKRETKTVYKPVETEMSVSSDSAKWNIFEVKKVK